MKHTQNHSQMNCPVWYKSTWAIVLFVFLGGLGGYLVIFHGPHLYSFLPWLFLLACPLIHLFHGHGDHKK